MVEKYEGAKASWNEAGYLVKRLDILQSRINAVRTNPLTWNYEQSCYNYQVWFSDLLSLLNEVWAKLDDKEMEDAKIFENTLRNAFKLMPPHKIIHKASTNERETKLNLYSWELIYNNLLIFERKIKEFLEHHGLSNPDDEGGDYF